MLQLWSQDWMTWFWRKVVEKSTVLHLNHFTKTELYIIYNEGEFLWKQICRMPRMHRAPVFPILNFVQFPLANRRCSLTRTESRPHPNRYAMEVYFASRMMWLQILFNPGALYWIPAITNVFDKDGCYAFLTCSYSIFRTRFCYWWDWFLNHWTACCRK